jgi:hypothetical protein
MLKYSNEYILPSLRLAFDNDLENDKTRTLGSIPSKTLTINTRYVYNEFKCYSDLDTVKIKSKIREETNLLVKDFEYMFIKKKIPPSRYSQITTYFLPNCFEKLEKMTCMEYLKTCSIKIPLRKRTVKVFFRKYRSLDEAKVSQNEMTKAIFDFHHGLVQNIQIEDLLRFLEIQTISNDNETSFNFDEFEAVFLFAERYFFHKCNNIPFQLELNQSVMLEKLDFNSLQTRFGTLELRPSLRNLLSFLCLKE